MLADFPISRLSTLVYFTHSFRKFSLDNTEVWTAAAWSSSPIPHSCAVSSLISISIKKFSLESYETKGDIIDCFRKNKYYSDMFIKAKIFEIDAQVYVENVSLQP